MLQVVPTTMMGRALAIGFLLMASLTTLACTDSYGGNDADPRAILGPRLRKPKRDAGAPAVQAEPDAGEDASDDPQLDVLELVGRTPEEEADAGLDELTK